LSPNLLYNLILNNLKPMSSPHNYTMKEQGSALGGILKNRKSGTMYDKGRSGMDTVKEQ
jgi:hypothetical protein